MNVRLKKPLFLVIVLLTCLPFLTGIIYYFEDWRGEQAWGKYQNELAAGGESLDWNAFVPLPVPDSQNFFKAPKMQLWFVKNGQIVTNDLTERLRHPDTTSTITNRDAALEYLAWSDQFEPDFKLIREALKRPYAQMDGSYANPVMVPIQNYVTVRAVVQTLAQRAKCHLLLRQPELALEDLTLVNESRHMLEARPTGQPITMVAAMINAAVVNVYREAIVTGLQSHAWQEPQLLVLQGQLEKIDLLPCLADAMRHERQFVKFVMTPRAINELDPEKFYPVRGWFHQNLITAVKWDQRLIKSIDLINHQLLPEPVDAVSSEKQGKKHLYTSPYSYFAASFTRNFSQAFVTSANSQMQADEAQTACALERYLLQNGRYPASLTMLVPRFIKTIPHDIIGGQPLIYSSKSPETFRLYSIGWNGTDDGGIITRTQGGRPDLENGDWVWNGPIP
jgi:hypothetical protein